MGVHRIVRTRSGLVIAAAIFALLPAGASCADAPPVYDAPTLSALSSIVDTAARSHYAYDYDEFLSDAIGPRLSGSPQAEAAAKYVASKMSALGLRVRMEPAMVPHWVRGDETGELLDWPGRMTQTHQKLVLTALGMSVATPAGGLTAPVVVVKNFDELSALGRAGVNGKIVLFDGHFDKTLAAEGAGGASYGALVVYRARGASAAARLGAVATLLRSLGSADYRLPHTGTVNYAKDAPKIPAAALSTEDADLIARLAAKGPVTAHITLTPQLLPDVESENVIADLPGTEEPNKVVIVSGHLDSWDLGTGATDDGAGVGEAMGALAVLHELGLHPRRTIRCIAWMNEENGTRGGNAYAKDEAANIADHIGAIEADGGAEMPLGITTSLGAGAAPLLDPIAGALAAVQAPHIVYQAGAETDIGAIVRLGVPAFAPEIPGPKYFDYHHTAADTFDKIDPAGIARNTAVVAALAYGLANATQLPAHEPLRE